MVQGKERERSSQLERKESMMSLKLLKTLACRWARRCWEAFRWKVAIALRVKKEQDLSCMRTKEKILSDSYGTPILSWRKEQYNRGK